MSGLEVCRRLRASTHPTRHMPIIMVTARDSIPDRVLGLQSGADDYLTKPFSIEELLARIEALLRRTQPGARSASALQFADLIVDTATREVQRGGRAIVLTTREYELLLYLLRHPRQTLSRQQIYDAVWGYDFVGESNVIDVYIRYLRNKLDQHGKHLIHTVRSVGYVLREEQEAG